MLLGPCPAVSSGSFGCSVYNFLGQCHTVFPSKLPPSNAPGLRFLHIRDNAYYFLFIAAIPVGVR